MSEAKPAPAAPVPAGGAGDASEAWSLMFRMILGFKDRFTSYAAALDLTFTQAKLLRFLKPGESRPMNSFAEALGCDASNVTGLVDRLETRGLVARQNAGHDRRIKMIVLTAEGEQMHHRITVQMDEPPPELADMDPADLASLCTMLRKLVNVSGDPAR